MPFADLQDFVAALERDGDLARVRVPVDPHLEVTGIVARTLRERGPALLFENPTRGRMPLLINAFGTHRRWHGGSGAVVLPASPGFYAASQSVAQLVDFVAAKVLDAIGVPHDLIARWTGTLGGGSRVASD